MIRRFVSVLLVVTVLGCGTPVRAWNQITHMYVNHCVWPHAPSFPKGVLPEEERQEAYCRFVCAGTYPDCWAFSEVGDHAHSPSPLDSKSEMTGVRWKESVNFATVWLKTVDLGSGYGDWDRWAGEGLGCHIAADWVAHTLVPIVHPRVNPSLASMHLLVETHMDAYVLEDRNFEAPDFRVFLDARMVRGAVISHALADYFPTGGADQHTVMGLRDGWQSQASLDLAKIEAGMAKQPAVVRLCRLAAELVRSHPAQHALMAACAAMLDFDSRLEDSIAQCTGWLENGCPSGPIPSFDFAPFYDPASETTPPGAFEPPPPGADALGLNMASSVTGGDPLADLLWHIVDQAVAAGLLILTKDVSPDGAAVYGVIIQDDVALRDFFLKEIAELARQPIQPESPGTTTAAALIAAKTLDRALNEEMVDLEAITDMLAPYVIPGTPAPDETVDYLYPVISMSFEDIWPSSGLDPASLKICIDGEPVLVTMPEGAWSFSKRLEAPVYQGYHTLAVSIADRMGQTKSVSWPFATALHHQWLPPVSTWPKTTVHARQTLPLRFTLRDGDGVFGADPGVTVRLFDPSDATGERVAVYRVGDRVKDLRINIPAEQYVLILSLRDLQWLASGMSLVIRVEAGGILLGECEVSIS